MIKALVLFSVSALIYKLILVVLTKKKVYQHIYELSPQTHQLKASTPSFGGVGFILSLTFGLIFYRCFSPLTTWVWLVFSSFSMIGFFDDFLSLKHQKNKGVSAIEKFLIQILFSIVFVWGYHLYFMSLSLWEWLFYVFILVGSSNATNLTDGLDGLCAGLSLISLAGFWILFERLNLQPMMTLLQICLIALLPFFILNLHPARQFLGDSGSLSIGAGLAAIAIASKLPLLLIPLGIVYILETLSVMIQVVIFKRTGKRFFKMAPLHHHFECSGFSEWKTVFVLWGVGILGFFVAIGYTYTAV